MLKYDDIRIKITYVIDELIEEYKVSKEIKETLLSFKDTFKEIIDDNRPLVKNLERLQGIRFSLGLSIFSQ